MKNCLKEYLKFTRLLMIYHLVNRMDENIILSPFSIQMLLSLISDATAGSAHNEVIRALEGGTIGPGRAGREGLSGPGSAGRRSMAGPGSAGREGLSGPGSAGREGLSDPRRVGREGLSDPRSAGREGLAGPGIAGRESLAGPGRPGRGSATGQEISEWLIYIQERMGRSPAFASSNAVCLRRDIGHTVNSQFREHLENFYNGEIISSPDMINDVNLWAARASRGMINEIADKSMSNILAFMLNCVVFESKWRYIYEDVKLDFTNADSSVKKVPMMAGTAEYYLENKYFTGFLRPYEDRAFYFMGLLPKKEAIAAFRRKAQAKKEAISALHRKGQTRKEAIGGLHQGIQAEKNANDREAEQKIPNRDFWTHALYETDFTRLYDSRTSGYELHVIMPEFKSEFTTNLEGFCNELGMKEIFSPGADFSPMTSEQIFLESIIQKARIEVDRHGTRAAAISMGAMPTCVGAHVRERKVVRLDRPFLYAIVECMNGMPVFEGILNQI